MSLERRKHPRSHVLRRGQVVFRDGYSVLDCVLLDLSPGGAQLRVDNWLTLPQRFEVRIKGGPRHLAEVRHRNMERTGVRFIGPHGGA
jgi:hypothetical protein